MDELDNYEPSKFLKTHRDFFKDYCFKFEGLSEDEERHFTCIVKELGGEVSKDAKYTLVEKSYFDKIENVNRKDLYHLYFLLDCINSEVIPNIELYRCIKSSSKGGNKNKENSSSLLQRKVNCNKSIDSRSGGNNVFQESNLTADEPEQLNQVNLQDIDKNLTKNTSKLKKRRPCIELSSSKIPCIELSSDDNESVTKTVKQNKKKKNKYSYDYDSDSSSSNGVNLKIQTANKKKIVNVKREPSSSDNSINCETDNELLIKKKKKVVPNVKESVVSQKKINSKSTSMSSWINTKNLENNRDNNNEDKRNSPPPSSPDSRKKPKIENRDDLKWLFAKDKKNICLVKNCTFAPGNHGKHSFAGRNMSGEEKRFMLRYLIKNDRIAHAKGIRIWENMISDGFLTHRSAETLRNSLRRVMLPKISKYNLPTDILNQFLKLEEKKTIDTEPW